MFEIIMIIDGIEYKYGSDSDRNRANEIAIKVREERNIETYVKEKWKMYKFLIENNENGSIKVIKGNSIDNALNKSGIDTTKWTVLTMIR